MSNLDRKIAKAPVSAAERDTLEAFRATPVFETHLTPSGTIAHEVNRDIEAEREARIGFINKRLARQHHRVRENFQHSR